MLDPEKVKACYIDALTWYIKYRPRHDGGLCYWLYCKDNLPTVHTLMGMVARRNLVTHADKIIDGFLPGPFGCTEARVQLARELLELFKANRLVFNPAIYAENTWEVK